MHINFVDSCLATKVFIGILAGYRKGLGHMILALHFGHGLYIDLDNVWRGINKKDPCH